MCGLITILAKHKTGFYSADRDLFTQMLYADVLRGSDATGIFGVRKNGNIDILKQATPAGWFLASKNYQETFSPDIVKEYQMLVGHNRKATHGDRKDADAHPFYSEPICLVHNGMISNHKELCKESTVDSNAVCNAFANGDFKETLREIEGAYAFIWYNIKDTTLYFIRNDKRPLFLIETNSLYILASEKEMVEWICARNNITIKQTTDCIPSTLYSFDLEKRELKEEKLDLKLVSKNFLPIIYNHSATNNQYYRPRASTLSELSSPLDEHVLLLSDKDFELNQQANLDPSFYIKRGDTLTFEIEELEDHTKSNFTGKLVRISGAILNCPKTPVTVVGYLPIPELPALHETFVASGIVTRLEYWKDKWTIYVHNTLPCDPVIKTKNDYWITNDMWMYEDFECHCAVCQEKATYEVLDQWQVNLRADLTEIICPVCSELGASECLTA